MCALPRASALAVCTAVIGLATAGRGADPLHAKIDRLIAAGQPNFAKQAAPPADDAEFLRRAYLDLTGTVPPTAVVRAFLADKSADKRTGLIDQLLGSRGYSRRMAQVFDVALMERRRDSKVPRAEWEKFLREAFAANTPYDQLVRVLLAADGADPKTRPAAKFVLDRDLEPNLVTRDIARVFLGRNLQCCQCHDHPQVEDYKQAEYYGLYAFFGRTSLFPSATVATAMVAEKADGETTFSSVFDSKKETKSTLPRLPGAEPIPDAPVEKGKEYTTAPTKTVRGIPAYSRREQLAKALPDNPRFARTAANRLWFVLLGRGLVHPLDLDHPDNPPSHPDLLDLLATEFAAHHYDVKYLLREIALSQTYQRSSVVPAALKDVPADRYLVANLKPLTPEQLAYAVAAAVEPLDTESPAVEARLAPRVTQFRAVFGGEPGEPEDSTATLDQTLFLKFGPVLREVTTTRPGTLADRVAKAADPAKAAEDLFLSVLSRPPTAGETAAVAAALSGPGRDALAAELVWALLASGEFRFNH